MSSPAPGPGTLPGTPDARPAPRGARAFLPEIQALRMWAVGLVVVFHLWPTGWFPGGFVGVDAFFVISGYLITSHLLREVRATGRIRLGAFYARRARRLLPASLLVLLVAAAATLALLPQETWPDVASEILASTFYVQNLWLASRAVTYSASTEAPSAVQHYWSLSTEEQFYLVWPSLILLALWIARRRSAAGAPHRPLRATGVVLVVVTLASLACSVLMTRSDPAAAYFVTPTRAWEFGVGALLPLLLARWMPPSQAAVLLRYAGLGGLLLSAVLITGQMPFPGWLALAPVLSTAAVVVAGDCGGRDPLEVLVTHRVTQWLGGISYSIYLWHWPLVVVAPYVVGGPLRHRHKLAVLVLTLVVAHLSKRHVEDVAQRLPRISTSPRATLVAAVSAMTVVAVSALGLTGAGALADRRQTEALAAAAGDSCHGGLAGLRRDRCPDAFTQPPLVVVGPADKRKAPIDGCSSDVDAFVRRCEWGRHTRTVALVGDSHAEQYVAAVADISRRRGWRLLVYAKRRCPAADALFPTYLGKPRQDPGECRAQMSRVNASLRAEGVDLVVTSAYSRSAPAAGADPAGAFRRVWDEWSTFADVVVIRDTPGTEEKDMPACLHQHQDDPRACALERTRALSPDDLTAAMRTTTNPKVHRVDLSSAYCDEGTCYAVAGGLPVYYDRNHVTTSLVKSLVPVLEAELPR